MRARWPNRGRLALAVELSERARATGGERRGGVKEVLELWQEALETDGGEPEPRAHRLVLDAMVRKGGKGEDEQLRRMYVEKVATVDLDAEAVPTLVRWIKDTMQAGEPMDAWARALMRSRRQVERVLERMRHLVCPSTTMEPKVCRSRPGSSSRTRHNAGGGNDVLSRYDDNRNGRITRKEARRHRIAPVRGSHHAYQYMRDGDGDGIYCER